MPITAIERPSHVIVDNSVLSMLTDCYCTNNVGVPAPQLLTQVQQWLSDQLANLRATAIENELHTTDLVSAEYKPERGYLGTRGLPAHQITPMTNHIRGQLRVSTMENKSIQALRSLPGANKRLINPKEGLSDCDLSLIQLGIHLTQQNQPVVILSNDQDLLDFVSWVRTQKSLRVGSINPLLLEGETGLGYMELIHRSCKIPSAQMGQMINFTINTTVSRMQQLADGTQLNPQKAMKIIQRATTINSLFTQAIEIKAQNRSVAP